MGMCLVGYGGMHRRIYNPFYYEELRRLIPLNEFVTVSALVLGAAQFIFLFNFVYSILKGKQAPANPWKVGTLEWTIPSPAPSYNFKEIPPNPPNKTDAAIV